MRNFDHLNVCVVGATGAVGREMISVLEEREVVLNSLRLFASKASAGKKVEFRGKELTVEELTRHSFEGIDVALFSAGGAVSAEFGPIAADAGAIVIDNSSHFRMKEDVPLIVPEVNGDVLRDMLRRLGSESGFIVANPNCSTIQLVVVLKPIMDAVGLERVVISTYQSVSGAGQKGMKELWEQLRSIFNQKEISVKAFPHQIAFNCLPQIDSFVDNGYTKEEMKIIQETRKILGKHDLRITATAVRVPVMSCHSESVNIETSKPLHPDDARELLQDADGVTVFDEPGKNIYPQAKDITGTDATFVGRIRADESVDNGLNMWIVADNLRKGAALNAVQILQLMIEECNGTTASNIFGRALGSMMEH